ncbi:MAG: hypothetical protein N3B12_00135 [Armatimonadetes bacterium]|nr:hypothetical protein [Armatimonadota bacterium]
MSRSSDQRSAEFLKIADQFKLGVLLTESSHPVTANLSDVAKRDISAALGLLFDVDGDVIRKYREFVESGRAEEIAKTVVDALSSGRRLFFTGCGSTGRLSIQLVSIWRDFWQRQSIAGDVAEDHVEPSGVCGDLENRAVSVMAGGDFALIKAVEGFEDFAEFGKRQIEDLGVSAGDVVFAITEGGETSFVVGTAWKGVEVGAKVYFVYNNPDEILIEHVKRSREVLQSPLIEKINLATGPMAITGSTRMQATTIQLCVLLTILEIVVCSISSLLGNGKGMSEIPKRFLSAIIELHNTLRSCELRAQLARLVAMEEFVYRRGHKNNYFADRFGIDVLADTTERSPTYCTPPFRKFDDTDAAESWSFLYVPYSDSPSAWRHILKRDPNCIDWSEDDVRKMVGEGNVKRQYEVVKRIGEQELMRFRIGLDGLSDRPLGPGDSAVAIFDESEQEALFSEGGFFRKQLESALAARAQAALIHVGSERSIDRVVEFISSWNPELTTVFLPVPDTGLLLDGVTRAGVKMLLNALSTCTMVRLGRVMGNYMIWVVPSNLKLIDRSTRYISQLTGLTYEEANRLLFEVVEYVEPRWKADQTYPPVVGLSVLRARYGLTNEEAEILLWKEMRG